ncbi:MAG TPA: hypothetical protein EYQ61_05580 [Dehalococcoidia bacterium]|nr:hypothetical protein [Dehalococcoidia bacterium]
MFKGWIPASSIAAAMALALAGGAVLAFGGGGRDSQRSDVFDRAAEILGISSGDLQDAHDQATREDQEVQLLAMVERLVASEVITQAEADSLTSWLAERPDSADVALFTKLTSSLLGSGISSKIDIRIHKSIRIEKDGIIDRMAEILGLDAGEVGDALKSGETEIEKLGRLDVLHAVIDDLLENSDITDEEATKLHDWINDAPQWLLEFDVTTQFLPKLGLFGERFGDRNWLRKLPFGRDHFGEGDHEFRFEFRNPEGTSRFGPGEHEFPFGGEEFEGLFERFKGLHELEGIEDLDELFERFEGFDGFDGYRFFDDPDFTKPTEVPNTTATSA